jgi:hypothetical protein
MAKQTLSIQKTDSDHFQPGWKLARPNVTVPTVANSSLPFSNVLTSSGASSLFKPIEKTEYCEVPHIHYHVSGRLRIRMADGSEEEFGPGDVGITPAGHDAWVVGDEPVVVIDISGMKEYAEPRAKRTARKVAKRKTGKKKR